MEKKENRLKLFDCVLDTSSAGFTRWLEENTLPAKRVVKCLNSLYELNEHPCLTILNQIMIAFLAKSHHEKCARWEKKILQQRMFRFEEAWQEERHRFPSHIDRLSQALTAKDVSLAIRWLERGTPLNLDEQRLGSEILKNNELLKRLGLTNYPLLKKLIFENGLWHEFHSKHQIEDILEKLTAGISDDNMEDFQNSFAEDFVAYAQRYGSKNFSWLIPASLHHVGRNQEAFLEKCFYNLFNINAALANELLFDIVSFCPNTHRNFIINLIKSNYAFQLFTYLNYNKHNFLHLCEDLVLLDLFIKEQPELFSFLIFLENNHGYIPIHWVKWEVFCLYIDRLEDQTLEKILFFKKKNEEIFTFFEALYSRHFYKFELLPWCKKIYERSPELFRRLLFHPNAESQILIHRAACTGHTSKGKAGSDFWEFLKLILTKEEFSQCLQIKDKKGKTSLDYAICNDDDFEVYHKPPKSNAPFLRFLIVDHPELLHRKK